MPAMLSAARASAGEMAERLSRYALHWHARVTYHRARYAEMISLALPAHRRFLARFSRLIFAR